VGGILLTVVLYRGRAPAPNRKGVRRSGDPADTVLPAGAIAARWPIASTARRGVVVSRDSGARRGVRSISRGRLANDDAPRFRCGVGGAESGERRRHGLRPSCASRLLRRGEEHRPPRDFARDRARGFARFVAVPTGCCEFRRHAIALRSRARRCAIVTPISGHPPVADSSPQFAAIGEG